MAIDGLSQAYYEREDAIVRSIMSGHNECGTLDKLAAKGGDDLEKFLRGMIRPTLQVCCDEYSQAMLTRNELLNDVEKKRFALEMVISNNGDIKNPHVNLALKNAMPEHPLL